MRWYRAAAEQGNTAAQFNLGVCYANGTGVVKGHAEAVRWTCKAAAQGFDSQLSAAATEALARPGVHAQYT